MALPELTAPTFVIPKGIGLQRSMTTQSPQILYFILSKDSASPKAETQELLVLMSSKIFFRMISEATRHTSLIVLSLRNLTPIFAPDNDAAFIIARVFLGEISIVAPVKINLKILTVSSSAVTTFILPSGRVFSLSGETLKGIFVVIIFLRLSSTFFDSA